MRPRIRAFRLAEVRTTISCTPQRSSTSMKDFQASIGGLETPKGFASEAAAP